MSEIEFLEKIEQETGLKIGEDYGFIMGTQTPFVPSKGIASDRPRKGYSVWKITEDGKKEADFIANDVETNVKEIIEFLR
jgi:hypothetical protein